MKWRFWVKEKLRTGHKIMPWEDCICPVCGKIVKAFEPCDCDDMDHITLDKAFMESLKEE